MKPFIVTLLVVAFGATLSAEPKEIMEEKEESAPSVTLGYVILYVDDVASSLEFYEKAFGLSRRFFSDEDGLAYGELETGAARLAFASKKLAKQNLKQDVTGTSLSEAPLSFEVALLTTDVPSLYQRALGEGAVSVMEPTQKPWGQTVAYVRDKDGHLVEICTPLP